VRQLRHDRGMTLQQVADGLGEDIDFRQVVRVENGTAAVELDLIERLAEVFKVPVWSFLDSLPGVDTHVSGAQAAALMEGWALREIALDWRSATEREAARRVVMAMVALPTAEIEAIAAFVASRAYVVYNGVDLPVTYMAVDRLDRTRGIADDLVEAG
jgi:transcriptional regulator with XRE-family HTH domain